MRIHALELAVPPEIATFLELHVVVSAAEHNDPLDGLGEQFALGILERERIVHVLLEGHNGAAPETAVGGNDQLGLGILDAVRDGLRAEAAEDDRMHGADTGAGEHGNGGLGHHRQVDEDAVARVDAVALEDIGEPADFVMKLFVGEGAFLAGLAGGGGLALPNQRGLVSAGGTEVPIEAVVADIELAANEPLGIRLLPFKCFGPALEPDQFLFGLPAPELLGGLDGLAIEPAILAERFDVGLAGEVLGRGKDA
jgi:hypothetical protein